jgi:hypothetical protein
MESPRSGNRIQLRFQEAVLLQDRAVAHFMGSKGRGAAATAYACRIIPVGLLCPAGWIIGMSGLSRQMGCCSRCPPEMSSGL